jgi:putrescine aminotransferase
MKRFDLIPLEAVDGLPQKEIVLRILGFDRYKIVRAEGMTLETECGRKILDFSGGLSVLGHGHNHPRILAARRRFNDERRLEICKAFVSPYQSVLGHNLAAVFPGDLQYSFFCNSGAEANEGALKIAYLYQPEHKDQFVYTDLGYHGKTFGTMSVSGDFSKPYRELFKTLDGCLEIPWGDIDAFRSLVAKRTSGGRNDIAAIILEPLKADLAMLPPEGYLKELAAACAEASILMIADEVFTGFGRTGKWFAFEHGDIVPDIVTFSKAFGGGKASIAGYIVKPHIFKKTYAAAARCVVHSTTYGGMGEECATAIEAINVIHEEGLVENARVQGAHLLARLEALREKHPKVVKDVRGVGLLCLIELYPTSQVFGSRLLKTIPRVDDWLLGLLPAAIVSELLKRHDVLIYTGGREDNLLVNPAMIVTREDVDRFADALDDVLGRSLWTLAAKLATNPLRQPTI